MHRYKDYGTNLGLLARFGGLKAPQYERHTENTPGIHWCSLQGQGNSLWYSHTAVHCQEQENSQYCTVQVSKTTHWLFLLQCRTATLWFSGCSSVLSPYQNLAESVRKNRTTSNPSVVLYQSWRLVVPVSPWKKLIHQVAVCCLRYNHHPSIRRLWGEVQ